MIIAVDFDGTIVENQYPKIGKEIPFAIDSLIKLQRQSQHRFILWTVREGDLLKEAISFCHERGLEFYAVNQNNPDDKVGSGPRKLNADLFIDDRNLGGMPDWGVIYRMIKANNSDKNYEEIYRSAFEVNKKAFLKQNIFLKIGTMLARKQ